MELKPLIIKYSQSGPRYTSYPTAPQWSSEVTPEDYRKLLSKTDALGSRDQIGLYVHLPFCESLCYFCGCNIQITNDKSRSASYVDAVVRELEMVSALLGEPRRGLTQVHWGGGTPTFLTLSEMEKVHRAVEKCFDIQKEADVSIEVDPRITSVAQLELLRALGFNRISLGVQDFNPKVQKEINRIQPAEMTEAMLNKCRELGFKGINFDLIYGLPHQNLGSFEATIDAVIQMRPSRIALYNYARLPKMLKHQVILEKFPMPEADERVDIFSMAYEKLSQAGYVAIGMDHFATEEDELSTAIDRGELYRNFMGYVARKSTDLIGVGASSIGELGGYFLQNEKSALAYETKIGKGELATIRGHLLSSDDLARKWLIQRIMCGFKIPFSEFEQQFHVPFQDYFGDLRPQLAPFVEDGILKDHKDGYEVTELGRIFVRNVAMVFDAYLNKSSAVYSKTV